MTSQYFPLVYKPGVQRDGTSFQADYCLDAVWVRFQGGFARKMGGMLGGMAQGARTITSMINVTPNPATHLRANIITGLYDANGAPSSKLMQGGMYLFGRGTIDNSVTIFTQPSPPSIWNSITFNYQNNPNSLMFICSFDAENVVDSSDSTILTIVGNQVPRALVNPPPKLSGICGGIFTSPYIILYGSNGLVQWSKATDSLDFRGNNNSVSISDSKILYGTEIRGGVNSPTLLFWSTDSLIRLYNVGNDNLTFQKQVVSTSCSTLSSRCVAEENGVFFWAGVDKFYYYNGLVDKLPNALSVNFFFDNIDMSKRQQVFALKVPRYNEIWWVFPIKPGTRLGYPHGTYNTWAVIYNYDLKTWYDTPFYRSAGVYSKYFGLTFTTGYSQVDINDNIEKLWLQEYDTFPNGSINEVVGNVSTPIPSTFQTPYMSWAAFNPTKQYVGADKWMRLERFETSIANMPAQTQNRMTVRTVSKRYPMSADVVSNTFPVLNETFPADDERRYKVDLNQEGKYMSLRFNSSDNFYMGQCQMLISLGDGQ